MGCPSEGPRPQALGIPTYSPTLHSLPSHPPCLFLPRCWDPAPHSSGAHPTAAASTPGPCPISPPHHSLMPSWQTRAERQLKRQNPHRVIRAHQQGHGKHEDPTGPHRTPQTPQDPTDLCEVPCNRPLIVGWERAVSSCPVFSDGIDSGEQPAHARNDWAAPSSLWSTFLAAQHF